MGRFVIHRYSRRLIAASLAFLLTIGGGAWIRPVQAAANDPLYSNVWGPSFVGGCYFHTADFTLGWMKTAVNKANATIGHSPYRNPDFHATTSTSTNGAVHYMSSNTNAL